ncbi:hypothetical protein BAE44_0002298 [Dichanthelium oligosanthes]|uniref:Uncharacterized protein n=1 Tax=Dichanthelium oligosanthes TaxID=888268 RepID=A0A1E5WH07_9POAL|nr:hypothetical protein BAE44_0002298 [Dichanthelium oligosanthes]
MEAAGRPKVKWLVGDLNIGVCFEVAKKLDIRVAAFWPASAACLAILLNVPTYVGEELINNQGESDYRTDMEFDNPSCSSVEDILFLTTGSQEQPRSRAAGRAERDETFQLAPGMPPLQTSLMPWMDRMGAPIGHPALFEAITRFNKFKDLAEVVICSSFHEAETGAFKLFSNILAIGPLFADREFQKPVGHYLPEDERCIKLLDAQPDRSVVYVAFGSMAVFDPCQFEVLAEGLELTGPPFLWVVRPDFTADLNMA